MTINRKKQVVRKYKNWERLEQEEVDNEDDDKRLRRVRTAASKAFILFGV